MGKKYLKKSYIQESINLYGIRFLLSFFKSRFKGEGKVLVKCCDGIGDALIRSKVAEKIVEKYGKENVLFMMQKSYTQLGEMLGYNTIGYTRKERKNFFTRLKKMYELNTMGFSKYINMEFTNDITTGNLFIDDMVGCEDPHWQVSRNNRYYNRTYKIRKAYVLDQAMDIYEGIFQESIDKKELIPDISDKFEVKEENIVIAVGSTGRHKVCSPKIMAEYIKVLKEKFPEKTVQLVGNGDTQMKYAKDLIDILGEEKIENLVNKTSLKEVFELLAKSYLFIGFDSGLYNACYAMRKKGIALFGEQWTTFMHNVPWIKILKPTKVREDIVDKEYPEKTINSITVEEFRKGVEEIL